jgi:hypothetical protein
MAAALVVLVLIALAYLALSRRNRSVDVWGARAIHALECADSEDDVTEASVARVECAMALLHQAILLARQGEKRAARFSIKNAITHADNAWADLDG